MDNWDDLRFVVALARYGSMAKAAQQLRTNTATVSRRIKRLTETTGTTFFQKSGVEWELTTEGRHLYELAAGFSDDLRSFSATGKEPHESERIIRVTAVEFLVNEVLCPALPRFLKRHPNITLELSASDKKVSLAYGEADIALRLTRPTEGRLVAKRISDLKMGIYGTTTDVENNWLGLPFDLNWTPEMKNGLAAFGCEPTARLASFRAIISALYSLYCKDPE